MAIYVTRKSRIEENVSCALEEVFFNMVKPRIVIVFQYYKAMEDLTCERSPM